MKTFTLLLFMAPALASAATTQCVGNEFRSQLEVKTRPTRVGLSVNATLTSFSGSTINLQGLKDYNDQKPMLRYSLVDQAGQAAELEFYYSFSSRPPCGRGSCEDLEPGKKQARLVYEGKAQTFTCHETSPF